MLLYADSSLATPERPGTPGGDAAAAADGLWGNLSRAVGLSGGGASGGGSDGWRPSPVKATDFGLSIRHRPDDPPLKSRSGTPAYRAPEVIRQVSGGVVGLGVEGFECGV